ncbi:SDR family oxidoreductase [Nocardioides sp. BP30]|uniref:SDR family NAD(P)-dependent oxidoreductase n=1 Tax=Nocardioides sp. BP30 TaxID=3036374 RepID=UPI002469829E|nr:SDR family oxidoreductase [Nocardioides sp. BP30]WGL52376.1 SDR family oxidoreductase [Nocardioides sp. BP30]
MDLELAGRRALVTGASKGIGLAIARALATEGASVIAGALTGSAELDELTRTADVRAVSVDLSSPAGPVALVEEATADGDLDILVNNVGAVRPRLQGFTAITDEDWAWTLGINFLAAVRTMRSAIPHLLQRPGASIVTISSVNAFLPDPGVIDYSAAKGALTNLCKSLSKELGPAVRVNTISPGPVRTDLWLGSGGVAATVGGSSGHDPAEVVRRQESQAATGRFTYPSEIADLALFLASPRAANITGSDFVIDGGLITTL